MQQPLILVINPGSTSTKVAVFCGRECRCSGEIHHPEEELAQFTSISGQFALRRDYVLAFLGQHKIPPKALSAAVGRGGLLPPNPGGVFLVDEALADLLASRPMVHHASNLGGIIAHAVAQPLGIPAYICDPVTTDELCAAARLSGLPELPRVSTFHALNSKAMARRVARSMGKALEECNLIVGHLGGGTSYCALEKGAAVDLVLDDEGSFSPQRSGGLPCADLVRLCYSDALTGEQAAKRIRGSGGITAYLGTTDLREVQARAQAGDEQAALVLEALALQIAKSLAQLAAVFSGRVDAVVLTGGMARSAYLMEKVIARVSFLAPVHVLPGEMEMEALAHAALDALGGARKVQIFCEAEKPQ